MADDGLSEAARKRSEFDDSFERLRDEANRHAAIDSDAASWDELRDSHDRLQKARIANTSARREIVRRRDYATPDFVRPGLGAEGAMNRRTSIVVAASAIIFIAVIGLLAFTAVRLTDEPVLVIAVTETLDNDGTCTWILDIELQNDLRDSIMITNPYVLINQGRVPFFSPSEFVPIDPGERHTFRAERRLSQDPCPANTEAIEHGSLWIQYDQLSPTVKSATIRHSL